MRHISLTLLYISELALVIIHPALTAVSSNLHKKPQQTPHTTKVHHDKHTVNRRQFIPAAPVSGSLIATCKPSCQVDCTPYCDFKCCVPRASWQTTPSMCAPYCPRYCYPKCSPKCCISGPAPVPAPVPTPVPAPVQALRQYLPAQFVKAPRPVVANCPGWCSPQCYPGCLYSCCMTHKARGLMPMEIQPSSNFALHLMPLEKINKYSYVAPHSLSPIVRPNGFNAWMPQLSARLWPLQTQPAVAPFCRLPCSKRCFPSCLPSCCAAMQGQPQSQLQPLPLSHSVLSRPPLFRSYPIPLPPEGFNANYPNLPGPPSPSCSNQCNPACYPECKPYCCTQRVLHPIIPPPQTQPVLPNTIQPAQLAPLTTSNRLSYCPPPCPPTCFPACTPGCCSAQLSQPNPPDVIVLIPRPPPVCPAPCPSTCYPQCDKSCCCQQTNIINGLYPLESSRATGMCASD